MEVGVSLALKTQRLWKSLSSWELRRERRCCRRAAAERAGFVNGSGCRRGSCFESCVCFGVFGEEWWPEGENLVDAAELHMNGKTFADILSLCFCFSLRELFEVIPDFFLTQVLNIPCNPRSSKSVDLRENRTRC